MKTYHYEQLIFCSSQKSIITGSSGFGVRTKSEGLEAEDAERICTASKTLYEVPGAQCATIEILQEHPQLSESYPHQYTYRKVELRDGSSRYIVARSMYLAADYGYYAQMESARRIGSNYIAHILVFDEPVSPSMLLQVIHDDLFLPHNTLCTPENEELGSLLVGEPTPLPSGEIMVQMADSIDSPSYETQAYEQHPVVPADVPLILALMQAYKNRQTDDYVKKIIYKAPHAQLMRLVEALTSLPELLTRDVCFQVNNMAVNGVEDGLTIQFLNEYNHREISTDCYIIVDALQETIHTCNIEDNAFFRKITDCCANCDNEQLAQLISVFMSMKSFTSEDLETAFAAMLLVDSKEPLTVETLEPDKVKKTLLALPPEQKERAQNKISDAINVAFSSEDIALIQRAMEIYHSLSSDKDVQLCISTEAVNRMMAVVFDEKNPLPVEWIETNCNTILSLLAMADSPLPEQPVFLQFISRLNSDTCWLAFAEFYYKEISLQVLNVLLENILFTGKQSKEHDPVISLGAQATDAKEIKRIEALLQSGKIIVKREQTVGCAVEKLWQAETEAGRVVPNRKKQIVNLFCQYAGNNEKEVMKHIKNESLLKVLQESNTWQQRLIRKASEFVPALSKFFCLLLLFSLPACKISFKNSEPHCSPYQALLYELPIEDVAEVVEKQYDNKDKLTAIRTYHINQEGYLTYYQQIGSDGLQDTSEVRYDYKKNKLRGVKSDGYKYEIEKDGNTITSVSVYKEGQANAVEADFYTYGRYGEVKRRTCFEKEYKKFYDFQYDDQLNVKSLTITNSNNNNKVVIEYDTKYNRPVKKMQYGGKKQKLLSTDTYAYSQSDKYDNFKFCIVKDAKGKVLYKIAREYRYFNEIENERKALRGAAEFTSYETQHLSDYSILNYFLNIPQRLRLNNYSHNTPSLGLAIVLLLLLLASIVLIIVFCNSRKWLRSFKGPQRQNGMHRTWMFNKEPYVDVLIVAACLLLSFFVAMTVLIIIGGLTYGLLWVFKILLIVLVWVGWIALIGGILVCFAGEYLYGAIAAIVGATIVLSRNAIKELGQDAVDWGFEFMKDLNLFSWGWSVVSNFWDVILLFVTTPLLLFLVAAVVIILCVFILMGMETLVMNLYRISRPCPVCGNRKSFLYLNSKGRPHLALLCPGIYGVFYQTNPETGEQMPTMIFNGKGRLSRQCMNCDSVIVGNTAAHKSSIGTEKHIAIVGHPSSGKSYLLYAALHDLMHTYKTISAHKDIASDVSINIEENYNRIAKGYDFQTQAKDQYRAVQLMVEHKPVAYHLFFYDMAGEMFSQRSTQSQQAMMFYRNVQSIVFMVDPTRLKSTIELSDNMQQWRSAIPQESEYFSLDNIYSSMYTVLNRLGNKTKHLQLTFVCSKADLGYLEACGYDAQSSEQQIEQFMRKDLKLANLINSAKNSFGNVHFAVSSVKPDYTKQRVELFVEILKKIGVSVK